MQVNITMYVDTLNVKLGNNPNRLLHTLIPMSNHTHWHSYMSHEQTYSGAGCINIQYQKEMQR